MDAMGSALKNKMKKAPAPPEKKVVAESRAEEAGESDDVEKAEQDLAPDVTDNKSSMAHGRKPMGLRERANEKMASIMKEKKGKGSY